MHLLQGAAARMAVVAGRREGQMGSTGPMTAPAPKRPMRRPTSPEDRRS
ncbi:hypothetical protein [Limimaricola cinnabarinus]|jgi:hypothetical protein|nr:hypothetical protein [Limimaricola cinnabarinus]